MLQEHSGTIWQSSVTELVGTSCSISICSTGKMVTGTQLMLIYFWNTQQPAGWRLQPSSLEMVPGAGVILIFLSFLNLPSCLCFYFVLHERLPVLIFDVSFLFFLLLFPGFISYGSERFFLFLSNHCPVILHPRSYLAIGHFII